MLYMVTSTRKLADLLRGSNSKCLLLISMFVALAFYAFWSIANFLEYCQK